MNRVISSDHSTSPLLLPALSPKNHSGPTLRKSCHFCRSRKIRCSGESICSACQLRNIECSYRVGGPKGRPKASLRRDPSTAEPQIETSEDTLISPLPTHTDSSSSSSSPRKRGGIKLHSMQHKRISPTDMKHTHPMDGVYVASNLQHMFNRLLGDRSSALTHSSDTILDAFSKQIPSENTGPEGKANLKDTDADSPSRSRVTIPYEELFLSLAKELVIMLVLRFADLGCHQEEPDRSRHFAKAFASDTTDVMFDPFDPPPSPLEGITNSMNADMTFSSLGAAKNNPLEEYNSHVTIQMLEIWFAQHPLSFISPKTLLLRDIRHDTHDEILLAAMLADVQCAHDSKESRLKGEYLFRWANSRLHHLEQKEVGLSTIQAVVLLGWHALCSSQARRATCYFVWASYAIHTLPTPQLVVNIVNGIDVGEIESESRCNTHWLIFAINLWAMMQIDSPGCELPPSSAPTTFPSGDKMASASFRLDRMSYNFSTLQNQERMFREFWLLSHVAATTSHIYALYPRTPSKEADQCDQISCWQIHTLRKLRHLSNPPQDITSLCARVRHVLLDSALLVETHVQPGHLQALVLAASHTMIIHFLFPSHASTLGSAAGGAVFAPTSIDQLTTNFCYSANALLHVFAVFKSADGHDGMADRLVMSLRSSSLPDIFSLALDACGRAISMLYDVEQTGSDIERQYVRERAGELAHLATQLHAFAKSLDRVNTQGIRIVEKKLRQAMLQFSGLQAASTTPAQLVLLDKLHEYDADFFGIDQLSRDSSTEIFNHNFSVMESDGFNGDRGLQYFINQDCSNSMALDVRQMAHPDPVPFMSDHPSFGDR